ncbi:MAG: HAMP domain-containing histidine kinase [Spirochaetota bacterium]|nr:MAG: HAMP domain-containing histidine kinase [Spirochaetota bacterium]
MKMNCWEYLLCDYGPTSKNPCSAAVDTTSEGVNNGKNAGRICWTLPDTLCFKKPMGKFDEKRDICFSCEFFQRVKLEEGNLFQLFKVAQGVQKTSDLHSTIAKMEHLFTIHDRLYSHFDLKTTLKAITSDAKSTTGAQRSLVLLMKGDPPALHGEFILRGKDHKVTIPLDETSAVGYAAIHNQVVNLRNLYEKSGSKDGLFNRTFDRQLTCETHSFLAIPVQSTDRRVIGVITAANAKKGYFSADDEWFMRTYAIEVALAVEKQKFLQQSFSALRLASIGETVAGLSHCIKNIAHALRGSSYIIKRAIDSNNVRDIKAAWEILDRHIESLANLSLDVLSYQPEAAEGEDGNKLNDIVCHVVNLYQEEARARAITLKTNLSRNVDPCSINSRGIYRLLINLISNAFDACPFSDGVVVIGTKRADKSTLIISVSDNGRGMDGTTKAEAFDLFKTTKADIGTGLGLPTVASIVKEHNGKMEIDTEPEKGTTFRIYIKEI